MAKVYKVSTGINKDNFIGSDKVLGNSVFNILNTFFPDMLRIYDGALSSGSYGRGIVGINSSENNGILFRYVSTTSPKLIRLYSANNGNVTDNFRYFKLWDVNQSNLTIFYIPIKNGVLMAFCGADEDYTKYMTKIFIKDNNNHVIFLGLDEITNTYGISLIDLTAGQYSLSFYNPMPKAAPIIDSSKICMSKMILDDSIQNDIYVASVVPITPTIAQSFIINDKEYIIATQPQGYCPMVFEIYPLKGGSN